MHIVVQGLCRHSLERSQAILAAVMEGFQVGSYHQYRPYFRVLSHLLGLADEHESARVELILASLLKVMDRQQHYWKETVSVWTGACCARMLLTKFTVTTAADCSGLLYGASAAVGSRFPLGLGMAECT